jgi:stalled ribosome alternative rescue factor ArfA
MLRRLTKKLIKKRKGKGERKRKKNKRNNKKWINLKIIAQKFVMVIKNK